MKFLKAAVLAALFAACGRAIPPNSVYDDGDQATGNCDDPPIVSPGPGGTGSACEDARDCGFVCCACSGDPDTFWGASCYRGYCADLTDTCDDVCASRG